MSFDLEKPLLEFDIDKEMSNLQDHYKIFIADLETIDKKVNQIEDKRDYSKIDTV
jgi:uncharacterized DUF497 family protein